MNSNFASVESEHRTQQLLIETFKELFDFSRDVLWLMAPDGQITYVSPAIFILRGISPELAKRQTIEEIHPPESAARSIAYFTYMLDEISKGRRPDPFQGSLDYFHANGTTIQTEVYAVPSFDGNGNFSFLAGVSRDISARVLKEEKARAEIRSREIELRKMLNTVLEHEVRSAIAVINFSMEGRSIEPSTAQVVKRSTANLLRVVEQVGLFSRSDDIKNLRAPMKISIAGMIGEIERNLGFESSLRLSGDTDAPVWGEHSLILQLFTQVLENAKQYAALESEVSIRIDGDLELDGRFTKISVSNSHVAPNGVDLTRLFDPFYRSPHVLDKSGSGLGLSIAKHLAEMLGGAISVDYEDGTFTTTVVLPQTAAARLK